MNYTTYDPATGRIQQTISATTRELAELNANGLPILDGSYSEQEYYIQDGAPVAKTSKPGEHYKFDYVIKSWTLNLEQAAQSARQARNELLSAIDRVNPVWYNSLTQEQQQELQTYRQALLDITTQAGFPTAITWPTKPTWL